MDDTSGYSYYTCEGSFGYSPSTISQTFTWSSSNTGIARVNSSTGAVTGVSPGTATITGTSASGRTTRFSVTVTQVANGTYFLCSRDTGRYADIENQTMAAGTVIHQWDFWGGNSQRWIFTHLGDGYYSIKSANGSSYYMGVLDDSSANNQNIVLRTGSITDGMKWKISVTSRGGYKITPKTGEANNRVLAVGWYAANVNGINIQQRDYVDDTNLKDEWALEKFQYHAVLYTYYDKGYYVRYGESEAASVARLNSYTNAISSRYYELLDLELITFAPIYYQSAIDNCKGNVNNTNIDILCSHSNPHTILFDGVNSLSSHFNNNTSPPGSDIITKAYWTGHRIKTYEEIEEYNRSYSSGSSIYMLELSSSSNRNKDSKGILMHEINHQIGAPDHYHEILASGACRGGALCSTCGSNARPSTCIMYDSRIDITASNVICSGCKEDIRAHLDDHHVMGT